MTTLAFEMQHIQNENERLKHIIHDMYQTIADSSFKPNSPYGQQLLKDLSNKIHEQAWKQKEMQ
jgi:hypothetical protein